MELAMLLDCLAVALGGALGSVCRYLLSLAPFAQVGNAGFPAATLLTNVVGAFAIGVVAGLAGVQAWPRHLRDRPWQHVSPSVVVFGSY